MMHLKLYAKLVFSFKLVLRVILREKELQVSFNLYNSSLEPFQFNMLFHTYLKVPDVRKCNISGLQGCMYVDKVWTGLINI